MIFISSYYQQQYYQDNMDQDRQKFILFSIATIPFVIAFVLNGTSYQSTYQLDLDVVPGLQAAGNNALNISMNIVSNIFNPVICAGYVMLIYLLSSRKLEVLVFLVWFIFLSFILSLLKQFFQQPRPYWVSSNVQMLEWTCYTEYGSPSGHSMLGIVLMEFLVRFSAQSISCVRSFQWFFYILAGLLELLVMFSRVYLGMHTINQVMFGLCIGIYSIMVYYLYVEKLIFQLSIMVMAKKGAIRTNVVMFALFLTLLALECLVTYLPKYNIQADWIARIQYWPRCKKYSQVTSFFLKCFEDSAIVVVIPMVFIAMNLMPNPTILLKKFAYSRCSCKFLVYLAITLLFSLIPVVIFLNPFWKRIKSLDNDGMAALLWFNNVMGFSFGIIFLVGLSPYLIRYFRLDDYKEPGSYMKFLNNSEDKPKKRRETEMESRMSEALQKTIELND